MSQLDSSGYRTMFRDGTWKVSNGVMVITRGTKMDTLYSTDGYTNVVTE